MGFLLALLSFVVAEEVVQLEPVQAYTINCATQTAKVNCNAFPWCWWSGNTCYNDTCLKAVPEGAVVGDCNPPGQTTSCALYTEDNLPYDDVCTDKNFPVLKYRKFCRNTAYLLTPLDVGHIGQCAYEYINSGNSSCDKWLCEPDKSSGNLGSGEFDYCGEKAASDANSSCLVIPTKEWCALNPKCYWKSDSLGCVEDTCTQFGVNCDTQKNTNNGGSGANDGKCSSYEVYDESAADGETRIMCVDAQKNAAPNKCYYLGHGTSSSLRQTDGTGPCQTISLPKCAANAECIAQNPTSGPYAGYYCGDAEHSADASVLMHIPSLLVLLLVAFLVF